MGALICTDLTPAVRCRTIQVFESFIWRSKTCRMRQGYAIIVATPLDGAQPGIKSSGQEGVSVSLSAPEFCGLLVATVTVVLGVTAILRAPRSDVRWIVETIARLFRR